MHRLKALLKDACLKVKFYSNEWVSEQFLNGTSILTNKWYNVLSAETRVPLHWFAKVPRRRTSRRRRLVATLGFVHQVSTSVTPVNDRTCFSQTKPCLQCLDAVGWVAGRAFGPQKTEWWGAGIVVWSEVQTCTWPTWCHCHSLSFASVKSTLVLPFWYRLTRVVPDKGPLNG